MNRVKYITLFSLCILILSILLIIKFVGSKDLKSAIEKKWKYPIEIQLIDIKTNIVIFKEVSHNNDNLYVINKFSKKNGRYFYNNNEEYGIQINSSYHIETNKVENIGNIIWGVFPNRQNKTEDRVVVYFKNNKDPNLNFYVEGKLRKDAFLIIPPKIYKNAELNSSDWEMSYKVD